MARAYAIEARVRKGIGGDQESFRQKLGVLFEGSDTDEILAGLMKLAQDASRLEKFDATVTRIASPEHDGAARHLARIIYAHRPEKVMSAIEGDPAAALAAICELLPVKASPEDVAVGSILRWLIKMRSGAG